jgi:hypothetical protein
LATWRAAGSHIVAWALAVTSALAVGVTAPQVAAAATRQSPLVGLEGMAVDSSTLMRGPVVTAPGLVWQQRGGGLDLTTAAATTSLAGATVLTSTAVGTDWMAVSEPSGVFAGRIGAALQPVPALRGCTPVQLAPIDEPAPFTVTGHELIVDVLSGCLGGGAGGHQVIVEVNLIAGRLRVLERAPAGIQAVAASGAMLATASSPAGSPSSLSVRVTDVRSGRLVYFARFSRQFPWSVGGFELQSDAAGDVLVTSPCCDTANPVSSVGAVVPPAAWWASPDSPIATSLGTELQSSPVLSAGRVAFAGWSPAQNAQALSVMTLATGTTQTVATFPGTAHVEHVGFSGTVIAWAQESFGWCGTPALGPIQLQTADLRDVPSPITEAGLPEPGPPPPGCVVAV